MSGDHYRVLGVAPDAPDDTVKDAFRRLALALHPDKAAGAAQDSAAAFAAVQRAWEVLREPAARRQYDAERAGRASGGGAAAPAGFQHATHTSGTITADDLVDMDDAGTAGVFQCRCGDALHVTVRHARGQPAPPQHPVASCPSCSLRYRVELLHPDDDVR